MAVVARSRDGPAHTLIARAAVVAVGGRQSWRHQTFVPGLGVADCRARLLPSNDLLSHDGLAEANQILRTAGDRRFVILGGSHSAYAVAWALLELPGAARLGDGQLAIVQRRPPPVFHPAPAAAAADDLPVDRGPPRPRTGRSTAGGLRGHGRDTTAHRWPARRRVETHRHLDRADLATLRCVRC